MVHFPHHFAFSQEGHTLICTFGDYSLAAARGTTSRTIESLDALVFSSPLEFAPARREPGRFFRAAFGYPTTDLTIVFADSPGSPDVSFMITSFHLPTTRQVLQELTRQTEFVSVPPDPDFISHIRQAATIELHTYALSLNHAPHLNVSAEMAFGAARYAHFLHGYRGVSLEEAFAEARKRFGLPLAPS